MKSLKPDIIGFKCDLSLYTEQTPLCRFHTSLLIFSTLLLCLVGCESPPFPSGSFLEGAFPSTEVEEASKSSDSDDEEPMPAIFGEGTPGLSVQSKKANQPLEAACVIASSHGNLRHGPYKRWHKDRKTLSETSTFQGGIRHGDYVLYYDNGQKKESGKYRFGLRHGKYKTWHRNGESHIMGERVDGELNGEFTITSDNGKSIQKGWYFVGMRHGPWTNKYIPLRGEETTIRSYFHYGQIADEL